MLKRMVLNSKRALRVETDLFVACKAAVFIVFFNGFRVLFVYILLHTTL